MARVFIGLGTNLGDREDNLRKAVELLRKLPHTQVVKISRWRETLPEGGPPQGPYLNGAAEIHTELPPLDMMTGLLEIENQMGRKRDGPRWGPRPIDLDLISYDDLLMQQEATPSPQAVAPPPTGIGHWGRLKYPDLTLPHPRAYQRRFVLEPLAEIAPDWKHPRLDKTAGELLASLSSDENCPKPR